jgi:predicted fused transcriptional regulator/phosphomethylpyrimidine kinase
MNKKIKSGKEILDNFFDEIELIPNVNQNLANALKVLYQSGKFTDINLSNKLAELRKEEENA